MCIRGVITLLSVFPCFPGTACMMVYRTVVWGPDSELLLSSQALPEDERPQRQQRPGLFLHNQTLLEGEVSASFLVTVRRLLGFMTFMFQILSVIHGHLSLVFCICLLLLDPISELAAAALSILPLVSTLAPHAVMYDACIMCWARAERGATGFLEQHLQTN